MSVSMLKHFTQLLRGLRKFIHGLSPAMLINQLFAFFTSLRRFVPTKLPSPSPHQRPGLATSSTVQNSGIVCAMDAPSPGPSDAHERDQRSPVNLPYSSGRNQSGHSLHEELHTLYSHNDNHTPNTGAPTGTCSSHLPGPDHANGLELETRPGSHPSLNVSILQQSRTSLSAQSSRASVSRRPASPQHSTGRALHHGPPARHSTLAAGEDASVSLPLSRTVSYFTAAPPSTDTSNPEIPRDTNDYLRFRPMSVTDLPRYDIHMIRDESKLNYTIEAMKYQYPETPEGVPEGWTACRHPEGALYFVHDTSRTFTDANICDEAIHGDIEYLRNRLSSWLNAEIGNPDLSELQVDQVQLVLRPMVDDEGVVCCYYFVNPGTEALFWLDEWHPIDIFTICDGALSEAHKGLAIRAQYWCVEHSVAYEVRIIEIRPRKHCALYPNFCQVTPELKNQVVATILHAASDHLTSNTSPCTLNRELLMNYLSLVQQVDPESTGTRDYSAIIISQIMHRFYDNHFVNYHWEECARLRGNRSVRGWRYHPSLLMSIVAPLLFMTPMNSVRLLHKVWIDRVLSKWDLFVTELSRQLKETSLLASVLLNANVGFLPKEPSTGSAAQQFLIYMSLAASIASTTLGLIFMGHLHIDSRSGINKVTEFLDCSWDDRHGLEKLGIIYSLPHAFLIWGVLLFFVALVVQWFDGTYPGSWQLRASGGVVVLPVIFLVVRSIWTIRYRSDVWWFQPDGPEPIQTAPEERKVVKQAPRQDEGITHASTENVESCSVQESRRVLVGTASPSHHDVRNRTVTPSESLPSTSSFHTPDMAGSFV